MVKTAISDWAGSPYLYVVVINCNCGDNETPSTVYNLPWQVSRGFSKGAQK